MLIKGPNKFSPCLKFDNLLSLKVCRHSKFTHGPTLSGIYTLGCPNLFIGQPRLEEDEKCPHLAARKLVLLLISGALLFQSLSSHCTWPYTWCILFVIVTSHHSNIGMTCIFKYFNIFFLKKLNLLGKSYWIFEPLLPRGHGLFLFCPASGWSLGWWPLNTWNWVVLQRPSPSSSRHDRYL